MNKENKFKAGHYEVHGETIAKFEFFDNGFNPYSCYLDIDKVDLILRKRNGDKINYTDIQVKLGKLYHCSGKWERELFDYTSWRFFKPDEFKNSHNNFYVAYVLLPDTGYKGDIFIFPGKEFDKLIKQGIKSNTKKGLQYKMHIARSIKDNRWYIWKKTKFENIDNTNTIDVTKFRRNFELI